MDIDLEIHPSDINAALLCELRLDEDLAEDQPNRDMMRGSVTHDMIEHHLNGVEENPWTYLEERLEEEYGYASIEDTGIPRSAFQLLIGEAAEAFVHWKTDVKPLIPDQELIVETEHDKFLGSRAYGEHMYIVTLVGTPDLVTDNRIWDWKTAARMWDPIKVTGQMQPPLYSHLVFGKPRPFTFWIYDMSAGEWHHLTVTPTQSQIDEAVETAIRVAIKREFGLLTATPGIPGFGKTRGWWCSPKYCRNWNKCTARHMTNDGNEDTKRDWRADWNE